MTIPARIGIVTLGVRDLERSCVFYEALGWQRRPSPADEVWWFETTGSYLGLYQLDDVAAQAHLVPQATPGFGGATLTITVATEEVVTASLHEARGAGGTVLKEGEPTEWGGFSGYVADPDGYAWEVAWNPFLPLDDEGRLNLP